jgi:dipeptidyl aminopeptidase
MAPPYRDDDEVAASFNPPHSARSSIDSTSTTSLILERIGKPIPPRYDDPEKRAEFDDDDDDDLEAAPRIAGEGNTKGMRKIVYIVGGILIGSWLLALAVYLSREAYRSSAEPVTTTGKTISMEQVMSGQWRARRKGIQWIAGERDGLMLVPNGGQGYLEVHDVKDADSITVLVKQRDIDVDGQIVGISKYWPSRDLKKVLLASDVQGVGFCPGLLGMGNGES